MTSSRPYLLRAIYDWLVDNELTPYILVDTTQPHVSVPQQYIEDGKIILNISHSAVSHLAMTNESVEFDARFSGVSSHLYVPTAAVIAIYAYENGRGMVFSDEDDLGIEEDDNDGGDDNPPSGGKPPSTKGHPHLKVVK